MTGWLQWTKHLPSMWKAAPLRAVADITVSNVDKIPVDGESTVHLCNYTDVYNNEFIRFGLEFMQGSATPNELKKFRLQSGDVVITKDSEEWDDIGIPALVTEAAEDLVCGYHLALLRPRPDKIDGRFLFRCLQAKMIRIHLELAANGVTRFGIPKDEIGKMMLPLPPLERQRAITDYLDRETARIDGLIAAKERLLELLEEKRRALITHAVTRGLDPDALMRESGLPWIREIPKHWQALRLKFFAHIYYGLSQPPEYRDSGTPFVRATNVSHGKISTEGLVYVDECDLPESRTIHLRSGDIIVVRSGAYTGDSAIVTQEWNGAIAGYDMVMRTHQLALSQFVAYAFLCQYILEAQIDPLRLRAAQPHLNAEELGDVVVILPPLDEQQDIVAHISSETEKIDSLASATQRTITLLKERRASLIAEAVTGMITALNIQ